MTVGKVQIAERYVKLCHMLRCFSSKVQSLQSHMKALIERLSVHEKMKDDWSKNYGTARLKFKGIMTQGTRIVNSIKEMIDELESLDADKIREETQQLMKQIELDVIQWSTTNSLLEQMADSNSIDEGRDRVEKLKQICTNLS